MRLGFALAFFGVLAGLLWAQPQKPKVHTISLGEDNLISLNPDYLVFSPFKKTEAKIPLLIYLHGSGAGRHLWFCKELRLCLQQFRVE